MASAPIVVACIATAVMVVGCASRPPATIDTSRTTVILLPDEDGHVGAVSVTTSHGSQKIDRSYTFTTVAGAQSGPSAVEPISEERVNAAFTELLRSQPLKPKSFTLYFVLDSAALTAESSATLPAIFAAVRDRKPTEIAIFGHTDAIGSDDRNIKLSAERARAVENLLRKREPDLGRIDVQFFGSQEPLIPTPPRAAEPRNRRAEIMIL